MTVARGLVHRQPTQTVEFLRDVLDYGAETGVFKWKKTLSQRNPAGNVAGTHDSMGYVTITVQRVLWRGHRLAWYMMTGESPTIVDHINGDRRDNRFCNLRAATCGQNRANQKVRKDSASGLKGIRKMKERPVWVVRITHARKHHNIGKFKCLGQAIKAHRLAAEKLQGEYAYHLSRAEGSP